MTQFRVVVKYATARVRDGESSYVDKFLPPGTVITGEFEVVEEPPKRRKGYADKRQRAAEDKAL